MLHGSASSNEGWTWTTSFRNTCRPGTVLALLIVEQIAIATSIWLSALDKLVYTGAVAWDESNDWFPCCVAFNRMRSNRTGPKAQKKRYVGSCTTKPDVVECEIIWLLDVLWGMHSSACMWWAAGTYSTFTVTLRRCSIGPRHASKPIFTAETNSAAPLLRGVLVLRSAFQYTEYIMFVIGHFLLEAF